MEAELFKTMPNAPQGFLIPQGSIQVLPVVLLEKLPSRRDHCDSAFLSLNIRKHPDQATPSYTLSHVLPTHCFVGSLRGETRFSWVVIATDTPQHPKQHIKSTLHSVRQYLGYQLTSALPLFICKIQWLNGTLSELLSISNCKF